MAVALPQFISKRSLKTEGSRLPDFFICNRESGAFRERF
jgi:hypothetical protein